MSSLNPAPPPPADAQAQLRVELQARLDRYPAQRYPVQHATTLFHLATVVLEADPVTAADDLDRAAALFDRDKLPLEHAKALLMAGIARRTAGDLVAAQACFVAAAEDFATLDQTAEEGAARFNLGLIAAATAQPDLARSSFISARERFAESRQPGAAAGAGRELGALLLDQGDPGEARRVLEAAQDAAERSGDPVALGSVSNVLGLARLASGDASGALAAFELAVASAPRSIRPQAHAMALANAALAHEAAAEHVNARLAARQALAMRSADAAVLEQARGLLTRLGDPLGDLADAIIGADEREWPGLLRREVLRWLELTDDDCEREWGQLLDFVVTRPDPVPVLESVVGVILEMPPRAAERLVATMLAPLGTSDPDTVERVRSGLSRALGRYPGPQLLRMSGLVTAAASRTGLAGEWR